MKTKGFFGFKHIPLMFLLVICLITFSFITNIILHELGHYAIAKSFDLDPTVHFFTSLFDDSGKLAFDLKRLNSEPVAYVQFTGTDDAWASFNVTIAGVMVNLLLAVFICFVYVHVERNLLSELVFLSFLVPTVISILINLNIFSPISDGTAMLQIILQMI
ncbi:hypothetical protein COV93_07440 [Candidatus Woesearchaeota archaeon CG11_big_fil_rev_8_21_14_0_20_43_8]|nr:MAG: hypothetical protein COV93_07440 [Candidatus Woesearchaeota archaeon CG11_big_fil_rev_8_21_14_0_20_43_8]PIO06817.1 MAG: hypothetical protein COT47_02640 [Candidatus Woesearchaeota archaeon CG08_land_8_20_14_0_20_43_7]